VVVEQSNDQALGQSGSLGSVHCIANGFVESAFPALMSWPIGGA